MSEWKKVKLGEICNIKSGKRLPKGCDFSDIPTKYKYIRARDIKNGIINGEELAYISEETQHKISKYIVNSDDIVITIVGASVGDVAYVSSLYNGVNLTENAVRLTQFNEDVNSRYLFYILNSPNYYQLMQRIAGGAAQPKMGIYKVEAIEVYLPSFPTQTRIATILSRYDSLIENYQKQIKLLEEAAQRLYKEWFIDLRFPGHENTKIVDGVPEGWEKKTIGDIVVYHDKQRKPLSSMQRMNMEKIYPYYGAAALMDYVDSYLFDGIYLLFGEDGTVITPDNFPVLQYVWGKFWVNNHAHVIRGIDGVSTEFLYSMFKEMPIADVVTGAAQPKISQGRLSDKKILMPSLKLIQEWSCTAKHYFGRIRMITDQIRHLTEARDRMFPKLLSGEIEV